MYKATNTIVFTNSMRMPHVIVLSRLINARMSAEPTHDNNRSSAERDSRMHSTVTSELNDFK
jgi:hypothetical protein